MDNNQRIAQEVLAAVGGAENILKRLVKIDKVAYIRFASVYREFKDVDEFSEELRSLENE